MVAVLPVLDVAAKIVLWPALAVLGVSAWGVSREITKALPWASLALLGYAAVLWARD
jgi:hypothetical protein